jgi:hypothetical protein
LLWEYDIKKLSNKDIEDLLKERLMQFGSNIYNEVIMTKSLMAINMYDDKNNQEMLKPFNWNEARNYILKETANYFKSHAS